MSTTTNIHLESESHIKGRYFNCSSGTMAIGVRVSNDIVTDGIDVFGQVDQLQEVIMQLQAALDLARAERKRGPISKKTNTVPEKAEESNAKFTESESLQAT